MPHAILHSRTQTRSCTGGRSAFTLVELLVVIGIIGLLIAILIPTLGGARDSANRLKCMNNLREIGVSMFAYSSGERDGGYPRTTFKPNAHLQLDNAGYGVQDSFGNKGYVGDNNVPASLFLLVKRQQMPTKMFICPSTDAVPGYADTGSKNSTDVQLSSNWELIPQHLSYSMAAPFPGTAAQSTFVWNNQMAADFALVADINPGTRGGSNPPNNSSGPAHDAAPRLMAAANSNNHGNKGQNVLYADGHVEFQTTPYCGAFRAVSGFRDNIYTAGGGDGGLTSDTAFPVDAQDSVLLPTDDPGGK